MKRAIAYAIVMVLLIGVAAWWVTDHRQFDFNEAPFDGSSIQRIRVWKPQQQTEETEISNPEQYTTAILSLLQEHTYRPINESGASGDVTLIDLYFSLPDNRWPVHFIISDSGHIEIEESDAVTSGQPYKIARNPKASKELFSQIYALLKDQLPPGAQ